MASLGLLANYGSDDDSTESFDEENNSSVQSESSTLMAPREVMVSIEPRLQEILPPENLASDAIGCLDDGTGTAKNLLISQDDSSGTDDEDTGDQKQISKPAEKLPNPLLGKLSLPRLGKKSKKVKKIKVKGSVFTNPFEKAEMAKQSILEKHVKMTEAQSAEGKHVKICWKFRKGRCPFKKNCRYSHDLDSNLSLRYQKDNTIEQGESSPASQGHGSRSHNKPPPQCHGFMGTMGTLSDGPPKPSPQRSYAQYRQQLQDMEEQADDDTDTISDKRKKRAGMAQSLVPPKKAMTSLNRFRSDERPWTVSDN